MAVRLSIEERVRIRQLHKQGLPEHQIARELGRSWWGVRLALRPTAATQVRLWEPSPSRLSMADREEIRAGIARGETYTTIARRLGRAVSTVSERWPPTVAVSTTGPCGLTAEQARGPGGPSRPS